MFGPHVMEEEVLQNLEPKTDVVSQQHALAYLEQLKNSETGWQFCMSTLTRGMTQDNQLRFFCFQVVEHYIRNHYNNENLADQQRVREFLSRWIQLQCTQLGRQEAIFLRNKAAQVFALVFVRDYPLHWTDFFGDLIKTLSFGPQAVDIYVRVLKAIDSEVADQDITHTHQEIERNAAIKNAMRGSCVEKLVESWYHILKTYETSNPELVNQCLEIIGAYVSWIDIGLVANARFIELLLSLLCVVESRESAADCLHDIISKGMEPLDKLQLIETLVPVLQSSGILKPLEDDETDFSCKLSHLVNGIGLNLIDAHNKLSKSGSVEQVALLQNAVERKVPIMIQFLSNDYDDVSAEVLEFAKEYIHMLKAKVMQTEEQLGYAHTLLLTIVYKMKYDESYRFEQEGEDEATFQEFRKQLKVLFDNLAGVNKELVIEYVTKFTTNTLCEWRTTSFEDVEIAIYLLYLMGEAIPASGGNHFTGDHTKVSAMQTMMHTLVTCDVSYHPHPAVTLQYVETVVRYEKFFNTEPEHIPYVLTSFLDQRGVRNSSPLVRSRCSYLFSRFVKCLRTLIQPYIKEVLGPLQFLLILNPPENGSRLISEDDQLYLYEAAAVMIVSGAFDAQQKGMLMSNMLIPVMEKFKTLVTQLLVETDERKQQLFAQTLCHAMAVTSRASKAFTNHQTMKSCCCVPVFVEATKVFLNCLQIPTQSQVLQSGVRQFLHRMVVCLEEELLPYVPRASEGLLKGNDIRSIQEYVPLIVQIIAKFKKEVIPFLQQVFMPIVNAIFSAQSLPIEENDEQGKREKQLLQRNYFQFIAAVVTNNVSEVLNAQDSRFLEQVMMSIIRGAVDFPDPVAQKTCFSILRKLVDLWGGKEQPDDFTQFIYKNIVPACFMAPLKSTFDLSDAQTLLALAESAMCLKAILQRRGDEFVSYLHTEYLPTLQISPQLIDEYCQALKAENKVFKNYVKIFFQQART
ncbi:exportin-T-like [Zootermopsis nevadensis]|uniref:exportin-T-like n=1 Tax=Zootermopsis nevadensis TaxID=136037 RepID=UPI000B8E8DB1|nr:exportin-T-like [Zootermopsis nevadensis]